MRSLSTKTRLIGAIGLILLAGFLAINFANYHASRQSLREALIHNELPLTSDNIYSEIQAGLLRPIYISSLMANDTFLKDWMLRGEREPDKVTKYLREIKNRYEVFSTFVVSNVTRRYYHFNGVLKSVARESRKDAWFFSMQDHGANYRVDVDTNEAADNTLTIFINHKLFDYDGNFIGVTGVGLNAIKVSELIRRYKRKYRRDIYLVDASGVVKAHGDRRVIDKANIHQLPGIAAVADRIVSGRGGFLEYSRNGDTILLTYRFLPELDWYLIVEQPERAALAQITRTFYVNTGAGLIITLVVLLISGYTVNRFQSQLEAMARFDKLSGFYNRQYFDVIFENAVKGWPRHRKPLSLIVFDIDAFKAINDRHGHLVGDAVIRGVATCVRRVVRGSDVIARWGGDEFIILLNDCDEAHARRVADKLRAGVAETLRVPANDTPVTVSAGVAQYHEGESCDELLGRADGQLYRAKQGRRRSGTTTQTGNRGDTTPADYSA